MEDYVLTNHDISKTERSKNTKDALSVIVEKEVEKEEINQKITESKKKKNIRKLRKMEDDVQNNYDISEIEKNKNIKDAPSVIVEKEKINQKTTKGKKKKEIRKQREMEDDVQNNHDISETEKSKNI